MAANYSLIASRPLVKVLSPTVVIPVQVCTIVTQPSGVTADLWVDQDTFDQGDAGQLLTGFAANIETLIGEGKAVGGTPSTSLDASGLQQVFVAFTVAYTPTSGTVGQITTDVDVPTSLLTPDDAGNATSGLQQAEALIDVAWSNLVTTAGDTPPPAAAPATATPPPPGG